MTAIEEAKNLLDEARQLFGDDDVGDHFEGWTLSDILGDFDRQFTDEERSELVQCPDEDETTSP